MMLQTPQASGLMPLPALPLFSQAEASVSTRKGKEKADVEPDDESDPSYKDQNDLSAQNIVQQVADTPYFLGPIELTSHFT